MIQLKQNPNLAMETSAVSVINEQAFLEDPAQVMRAGVYELLGRLLEREPDESLLQLLRGIGEVDTSDGRIAMGWELMKQASQKAEVNALRDEFFALFIGLGRGELVPFGSWYLTGFLMEKPVAALRADLARLGIERQDGVQESEDHIAALCDAMALVIRSGKDVSLTDQRAFFDTHIAPWAGKFCHDLHNAKAADFYRSVGFFGEGFFEFEAQLLAMQS
jgi:TorA maturation chaperone TorD